MSGSDLERFMLACSDLNQPARSRLLQNRPGLKDIKVQPRPTASPTAFQTSQKARDWSQLDLGDAFSQAAPPPASRQAALSGDADWDEFADFQSCPPQPTAPSAGPGDPLTGAGLSLMAAASSGTLTANGLPPAAAAPISYWGSPGSGLAGLPVPHPGRQTVLSAPLSVPNSHPGPLASQAVLQTGLLCLSSADLNVGGPVPTEPAPAAGYTPVPAFRPAAKPTRFRQGLVPLPAHPDEDFAGFMAAEPAPAPAERRRSSGGRPSRLPTLDDSPPPCASSPVSEDIYAGLRDLPVAPGSDGAGGAQDLLGLDCPSVASDLPPALHPTLPAPALAPASLCASPGPALDDFSTCLSAPAGPPAEEEEGFGEFVSVGQAVAGGASSRHGSLPSLDLQVAASDGGEVSPLEPDRRDTAGRQDKYDSFRQEVTAGQSGVSESALVAEWRRCLQACYELLQEGVALFGSVADQRTCSEVAGSRQGADYVDSLSRVYRVAGRIERACEQHGCRHQLELILSETCKAWANLTAFVANSPTRAAVSGGWPAEAVSEPSPCCGVCLMPTAETAGAEPTLACAGRLYHACCANLWVNRVADVLPALGP